MKRNCTKCGKPGHKAPTCGLTDEQRKERRRGQKRGKKVGKSWLKTVEKKLEDAAELEVDETPPDRPGEPFADLGPIELPSSAPNQTEESADSASESASTSPSSETESTAATSGASGGTKAKDPFLGTEELAKMAAEMIEQGVLGLGQYAAERGMFALGEPFAKIAGASAAIIVKANATRWDVAPEEAAAWVLAGVVGFNGTQAFRAYQKVNREAKEKAAHEHREREAARFRSGAPPVNGVARPEPQQPDQRPEPAASPFAGGAVV